MLNQVAVVLAIYKLKPYRSLIYIQVLLYPSVSRNNT
jgi:hypothetical protein